MKKRYCSILIILGAAIGYFLTTSFALSEPLSFMIADDPTIKGKGKDGQCMDYAIAVSGKLAANGIHGHLIFYRWHIRNTPITGRHALVMFRLPHHSDYIVNNEIYHPRKVARQ